MRVTGQGEHSLASPLCDMHTAINQTSLVVRTKLWTGAFFCYLVPTLPVFTNLETQARRFSSWKRVYFTCMLYSNEFFSGMQPHTRERSLSPNNDHLNFHAN